MKERTLPAVVGKAASHLIYDAIVFVDQKHDLARQRESRSKGRGQAINSLKYLIRIPAYFMKVSLIYDAVVFVDQIATRLFVSPALSRMKPGRGTSWSK